jgi:hypothetical protein
VASRQGSDWELVVVRIRSGRLILWPDSGVFGRLWAFQVCFWTILGVFPSARLDPVRQLQYPHESARSGAPDSPDLALIRALPEGTAKGQLNHVLRRIVSRCSPRHSPRGVLVLATSFTAQRTIARHVIDCIVHQCSPRLPPHSAPVLAPSSTAKCTGARHLTHCIVYRCSPRHPPHSKPALAMSSITY